MLVSLCSPNQKCVREMRWVDSKESITALQDICCDCLTVCCTARACKVCFLKECLRCLRQALAISGTETCDQQCGSNSKVVSMHEVK